MLRNTSTQATTVNNVGTYDRVVRMLFAATLLAPAFVVSNAEPLGWLVLPVLASIYPAATAVMGWDPIYHGLNLSTARAKPASGDTAQDPAQTVEALMRRYHGTGTSTSVDMHVTALDASNHSPQKQRAA